MPVDLIIVLIVILAVVLMWRGPKTLPKWGEALGHAVRGAREEATKAQAGIQRRLDDDEPGDNTRPPA
ncbi:MAG TPA: twin-arginine translocase TatA/TatE family subunit [Clostridia bacterium]|nr:twin-arginine translocase TatA/TatE family subunit [Clostridia bacterium]